MEKLEPTNKKIFNTPIQDTHLLVRMGVHNIHREILYRISDEFKRLNVKEQETFLTRLINVIELKSLKSSLSETIEDIYQDAGVVTDILSLIIPLDKIKGIIKNIKSNMDFYAKLKDKLKNNKEINSLSIEERENIVDKIINHIRSKQPTVKIDDSELLLQITKKLKRKCCFIDQTTKLPYKIEGHGKKTIVVLSWEEKHFEIIGWVQKNKKCFWEFHHNHPVMKRIENYLNGDLFLKKYNYMETYSPLKKTFEYTPEQKSDDVEDNGDIVDTGDDGDEDNGDENVKDTGDDGDEDNGDENVKDTGDDGVEYNGDIVDTGDDGVEDNGDIVDTGDEGDDGVEDNGDENVEDNGDENVEDNGGEVY